MSKIENPILRGFNPDPSIIRVGDDYYIATSTFEWFPGVQIHHSKDLINWELIGHALTRTSQLDMRGIPDSCGVWAPCLTHHGGTFYLVYSNVKSFQGVWKDTPNYLITTDDIRGEWSDPIYLSSMGFDGSLFHDEDGRKWYSSILVDHRNNKFFGGIVLQEYDPESKRLIGTPELIFEGTELGKTEGPHLYKKDGFYYLITAEGGTEYDHAITVARSKNIKGPYEVHPNNPFVSSNMDPKWPLQKAGHGDLVEDKAGNWYTVFLVGRPLSERGRCTLGRETAIEQFNWEQGEWPSLTHDHSKPRVSFEISGEISKHENRLFVDSFDKRILDVNWNSLRIPIDQSWLQLNTGKLRLIGQESLSSFNRQSLIARRIQSFKIEVTTAITFSANSFHQMAGLVFYYNTTHYHYLHLTSSFNSDNQLLSIITCNKGSFSEPIAAPISIERAKKIHLRGTFEYKDIQFYYSLDGSSWQKIGPPLDGSILSDDYVQKDGEKYLPAFTGAFVGLCCQDLSGQNSPADFHFFKYKELDNHK